MAIKCLISYRRLFVGPSAWRSGVCVALLAISAAGCSRHLSNLVGEQPLPEVSKAPTPSPTPGTKSAAQPLSKSATSTAKGPTKKSAAPNAPKPDELTLAEIEKALTTRAVEPNAQGATLPKTIDGWYLRFEVDEFKPLAQGDYHWGHEALERYLASHENDFSGLKIALRSREPFVAAVATIALARHDPHASTKPLVKLIRDLNQPTTLRRAAIETLARGQRIQGEAEIRALLTLYGPNDQGKIIEPNVYAELLTAFARHVDVTTEPVFEEALRHEIPELQVTVLTLFTASKAPLLPPEIVELCDSDNARVRRAALAALTAAKDPLALQLVQAGTRDVDLTVRLTSIELLGQMKCADSLATLYDLHRDALERHREAVAAAFVQRQEWEAVERAARDPSYRVRSAVATGLAKHGDAQRVELARQLLVDSSAMVQAKQAEALASWPAELAMPLLLDALASPNRMTRVAAHKSVKQIWPKEAENFEPVESAEKRAPQLAQLRERWRAEHPVANAVTTIAGETAVPTISASERTEVLRLLRQYHQPQGSSQRWMAHKQLQKRGAALLPILVTLATEDQHLLDEAAYRELLPEISPQFATIEKLRSPDVTERRAAARQIAAQAKKDPLNILALRRIEHIALTESDALVWGDFLRIADATPDHVAHEMAMSALAHGEADVRRRSCEYLAGHGDQRQAKVLLELIDDRDPVVKKAAIVALGKCGPVPQADRLVKMLADRDLELQIAAAKSLTKWNDPRGAATLERLALAPSAANRRAALQAMGELADEQFLPVTIKALDDEASVQIMALRMLPAVSGADPLKGLQPQPSSAAEKAKAWREWYASRPDRRAS